MISEYIRLPMLVAVLYVFSGTVQAALLFEKVFQQPYQPGPSEVWLLSGQNHEPTPQILILELSPKPGTPYHRRINVERTVLPGPFRIPLYPADFRTPRKQRVNIDKDSMLKIFTATRHAKITDTSLTREQRGPISSTVYAYDLGPSDSAVLQGFIPLTPEHPSIIAGNIVAFSRLGPDPLIRDGIAGIECLKLSLPNGRWRVHIWTEDIGDWQHLPPLIERRIRVNGQDIIMQRQTAKEWIKSRYVKHKFNAARNSRSQSSWELIGQFRGDLISAEVTIQNNQLRLDLAGANRQATTITGLLLEPIAEQHLEAVKRRQQQWFEARWPMVNTNIKPEKTASNALTLARGETRFENLQLHSSYHISEVNISSGPLNTTLRQRHHQLSRLVPGGSLLQRKATLLTAAAPEDLLSDQLSIRISVPDQLAPGRYPITVSVGEERHTLNVEVLDTRLAVLDIPVGLYLEDAPHLYGNYDLSSLSPLQRHCDLQFIRTMGITGIAPPLPTPSETDSRLELVNELALLESFGYQSPILAYTPFKRLMGTDPANAAERIKKVERIIEESRLPKLAWSVADEPSNLSSYPYPLEQVRSVLQNASRNEKQPLTAAHLNQKADKQYLKSLDIALINEGFGVDGKDIERVRTAGTEPWFYNLSSARLAGGFYLWKHRVSGYLQWHARMPTADPYDPTDGREDDIQMMPAMARVCATTPDITQQLIDLVHGVNDRRWLSWLDEQAKHHSDARQLRQKLLHKIPSNWPSDPLKTERKTDQWLHQIHQLARELTQQNH